VTIIEALADPRILGGLPCFAKLDSWKHWLVFLTALYGLPFSHLRDKTGITEGEALAIFGKHTGRSTYAPQPGGYSMAAAIVGRQAAKTRIAATVVD